MADATPIHSAQSIRAQAQAEVNKDIAEGAKRKLVAKLREIAGAKKVVANLEGELAVIEADIAAELGG